MKISWHRIPAHCEQCQKAPTILGLYSAADGEILLDCICINCGIRFQYITDSVTLIRTSYAADVHEANPQPAPATFTEEDKKSFKELHIIFPNEEAA